MAVRDRERLKEELLRALEEDRELRLAIMGLLGYSEVLERITRLEERFAKLEERFARLEERVTRLEERFARLEERQQKLEERFARLEERFAKLEEEMVHLKRTVIVVAHRYGVISEEGFREAMRYVIEEALGAGIVERWIYNDTEGVVYDKPAIVEVDVLVRDSVHILVEVKSRVSKADVMELYRIGRLYERVMGVKPRLVIVGGFIDKGARVLAKKMGVELVPIIEESSWLHSS